jgi:basic membrane protein A
VIGVVGPIEVGDAKLFVDGFVNGAQAQNASIEPNVNYIGDFSNVALASEAAQSMVSAGADVLTGTAQMTVGAIGVAAENGAAWFGTQSNQTSVAPDVVVASQVYHWEVVLSQIVDNIRGGTLGGEIYAIDLANGGLVIEYNDQYALADDIASLGETAAAGIADGSIDTGA